MIQSISNDYNNYPTPQLQESRASAPILSLQAQPEQDTVQFGQNKNSPPKKKTQILPIAIGSLIIGGAIAMASKGKFYF